MGENLFTDDWLAQCNKVFFDATNAIRNIMTITPPDLFDGIDKLCNDPKETYSGFFPRYSSENDAAMSWSLGINILAPGINRFANIAILTDGELGAIYDNNTMAYTLFIQIHLCYKFLGSGAGRESVSTFSREFIDGLRQRTLLSDQVLFNVLYDAVSAVPEVEEKILQHIRCKLLESGSRNTVFLFNAAKFWLGTASFWLDKSRYELERLYQTTKNQNQLLNDCVSEFQEIASGLNASKSFTKSKIIKSYRERLEKEIQKLKNYFRI